MRKISSDGPQLCILLCILQPQGLVADSVRIGNSYDLKFAKKLYLLIVCRYPWKNPGIFWKKFPFHVDVSKK